MRRQQRATIVFLSVLIIAALCVLEVGAAQPGPRLWIEPAQLELDSNESFSLQVMIEGVDNLGGFQIELAYDPAVVEVTEGAVGDFLTSTGRNKIPVGPTIDEEAGTVVLGAATFGEAAGAEGSGVLATISGTALADGVSPLRLQEVQVLDTAASAMSVEAEGGQVLVGDAEAEAEAEEATTSAATPAEPSPSPASATAPPEEVVESDPSGPADAPARTVRWTWIVAAVVVAGLGGAALLIGARRQGDGEGESM